MSDLKQCPYNEACQCLMDDPCEGCEDYMACFGIKDEFNFKKCRHCSVMRNCHMKILKKDVGIVNVD